MFQKFANILSERSAERTFLRDAATTKRLQAVWDEHGLALFPDELHDHLRQSVRIVRVQKDTVTIAARDAHTKNALQLKQAAIIGLFEEKMSVTYETIRLTLRQ